MAGKWHQGLVGNISALGLIEETKTPVVAGALSYRLSKI
jgi:hypothetical protein